MKEDKTRILLSPNDLADRWRLTETTLSQWRWNGKGPIFLKLGRHVAYRLEDVELFEKQCLRRDTTCTSSALTSTEYNMIIKEKNVTPYL